MIPTSFRAERGHKSIHDVPERQRTEMLQTHLEWKYSTCSDFMSWSSSLLWVLVHGIRRRYHQGEDDIHICIMDTQKAKDNAIYPARALMKAWNVKKPEDWYTVEYLVCGRLEAFRGDVYTTVPLDTLERRGLYDVLPELGVDRESDELHKRVERLRGHIFTSNDPAASRLIFSAMTLGDTRPNHQFHLPMTLAFVALRNRTVYDDGVLESIFEKFENADLPAWLSDPFELQKIQAFGRRNKKLLEVAEFASLLSEMCQKRIKAYTHPSESSQHLQSKSAEASASRDKDQGDDRLDEKFEKLDREL